MAAVKASFFVPRSRPRPHVNDDYPPGVSTSS